MINWNISYNCISDPAKRLYPNGYFQAGVKEKNIESQDTSEDKLSLDGETELTSDQQPEVPILWTDNRWYLNIKVCVNIYRLYYRLLSKNWKYSDFLYLIIRLLRPSRLPQPLLGQCQCLRLWCRSVKRILMLLPWTGGKRTAPPSCCQRSDQRVQLQTSPASSDVWPSSSTWRELLCTSLNTSIIWKTWANPRPVNQI